MNETDPDAEAGGPRLVVQFSSLGHVFTHLFTLLYATAVLHLPGVFGLPFYALGYLGIGFLVVAWVIAWIAWFILLARKRRKRRQQGL